MSSDAYHILRASLEDYVKSPDSKPLPEDTEKANGLGRSQTMPTPDAQKSDFCVRQRRASQSDSLLTLSGNRPSDSGIAEKPRQWPEEVEKSSDLIATGPLDDDKSYSPNQTENASGDFLQTPSVKFDLSGLIFVLGIKINKSKASKSRRQKLERHYKIERVVSFIVTVLTTTGSWAYLILAILKEDQLDRHGSTAQTLYAIAAKSIEICFSVTFLTAVNLHFFHRAADKTRGITFATIHTRKWVSSPSSVLFSLPLLKEVGLTFITLSTLLAMLGVLLYTTAAQTLVFPSLSKDNHQNMDLSHDIDLPYMGILMEPVLEASYAQRNISEGAAETHMAQVSVAIVGLTNIAVTSWIDAAEDWVDTKTEPRPVPQSPMDETAGVSMTAAWINGTESLLRWDRLVDNATLVYPHMEVARYMTGDDCDVNHYTDQIEVTVDAVSPMVNTLCAKMSDSDVDVWNDLYRAANHSTSSNDSSTSDLKKLLSSDEYKPLRDIAEIFGWEQLEDVPGTMVTNLTHNKTDFVVFHSINANSSASAAYFQFPYYATLNTQNVVCRIQGDLTDGCSSRYSLNTGSPRIHQTEISFPSASALH
ncbi:hypothetical protein KEM56_000850 [Ascosphaera pollenicola]|nr:hypothetical protein KEM56_000850 [Ascosphaera pollenicola]